MFPASPFSLAFSATSGFAWLIVQFRCLFSGIFPPRWLCCSLPLLCSLVCLPACFFIRRFRGRESSPRHLAQRGEGVGRGEGADGGPSQGARRLPASTHRYMLLVVAVVVVVVVVMMMMMTTMLVVMMVDDDDDDDDHDDVGCDDC